MSDKLTISPCNVDENGNITGVKSEGFKVKLNPSNYSRERSIEYSEKKSLGQHGGEAKFSAYGADTVKFDLILDGTGVTGNKETDVKTQIEDLENVVYKYIGDKHEPNIVRLLWGSLILYGRLTSMSMEFTLFKPTGEPLRAKVSLSFRGSMTSAEEARRARRSSPDLTHSIEVKAGDTLPLLCYRIYQDSSYYLEVARANKISNFRDLKPGTRLQFPPIR